jgi:hypothetical protein
MQSQPPDPIARLWTAARAMFARMRAALAEVLAAREVLSLDHKHAVRCWLAPLEAIARKIVLVHALALLERGDAYAKRGDTRSAAKLTTRADTRLCEPAASALGAARASSLRLWPRAPAGARTHPGRNSAQLAMARRMRRSEPERLARRVDALARILASPLAASRRLARTLAAKPHVALKLALMPAPRTPLYPEPEYAQASARAFNDAYDWSMRHAHDTS